MKRPARLRNSKVKTLSAKFKGKSKSLFSHYFIEFFTVVLCILFFTFCVLCFAFPVHAASGINKQINFQGKLVDNNGLNVADSTYTVVFSLYTTSSGGSAVWTESDSVSTLNGVFQVALGANTAFPGNVDFNSDSLYLGIKVNSDTEMSPRIRFSAVPYAFNAAALDGVVATNSASQFTITGATNSLLTLTVNGNLTLGSTIQPTAAGGLTVDTNGANTLSLGTSANSITFGATNNPTYAFNGTGSITFQGTSFTLGNGNTATFQTSSNGGLTFLSSGTGNITLGQNSGVGNIIVQPNAGGQAAFIINKQGSNGDIFTASASGTTQFLLTNGGTTVLGSGVTDTNALSQSALTIFDNGKGNSALDVDQLGTADIFTASSSGVPVFTVAKVNGTAANGFKFTGSATNNAIAQTATGSDTNIGLTIDGKGTGTIIIGGTSTGNVSLGTSTTTKTIQIGASATAADTIILGNSSDAALKFGKFTTANGVAYISATDGTAAETTVNSGTVECLTQTTSGAPTWAACNSGVTSQWQEVINTGSNPNYTYISPTTITDGLSIGVTGTGANLVPYSGVYIEPPSNTKGNALVVFNQTGNGDIFTASTSGATQFIITGNGEAVLGAGVKDTDALSQSALLIKQNGKGNSVEVVNQLGTGDVFTASSSGVPVFTIGKVTGTAANGFTFTGSSTTNAVAQAATGSDTNIGLTIDGKGTGGLILNGTATGVTTVGHGLTLSSGTTLTLTGDTVSGTPTWSSNQAITLSTAAQPNITSLGTLTGLTVSGTSTHTSTSATAFTVASSGTNYGLQVDESAGSAVTGIKIAAAVTGGTTALTVLDTGANSNLSADAKGTGTITIGGTSTGTITLGNNGGLGNVVVQPNAGGQAALVINDNGGVGDTFTASASGVTQFRLTNSGTFLFQGTDLVSSASGAIGNGSGAYVNALGDEGSLIPDAGFESAIENAWGDGWFPAATTSAGIFTRDTSTPAKGTASLLATPANGTTVAIYSSCIPVAGGLGSYTLNYYAKASSTNKITVAAVVDTYSSKANCQSDRSVSLSVVKAAANITTSWATYGSGTVPISLPSNTWARIHFIFVSTQAGANAEIDGVRFTEATTGVGVDYAENYPADPSNTPQPGDVVTLELVNGSAVVKSADQPNESGVIGVVSTNPGELLDDGKIPDPKVPIALAGRIPTKVSTANGPIEVGDYLTSSNIPGVAVKALTPGQVIGVAMEADTDIDATAVKQVTMFVKNSYYAGSSALAGATDGISDLLGTSISSASGNLTLQDLSVGGLATISGDLRVKGNGLFEGLLTVLDTLTTKNLIVSNISDFFDNAVFHKDITVQGHMSVLGDTAGTLIVHKGDKKAMVTFANAYATPPIITASLLLDETSASNSSVLEKRFFIQHYSYVVTNVTDKGFSVALNKAAADDVLFTWTALGQGIVSPTP